MDNKRWVFAGSIKGARASANLYSLVEMAKANGHKPHGHIQKVLARLPAAQSPDEVEALLPLNLQPEKWLVAK